MKCCLLETLQTLLVLSLALLLISTWVKTVGPHVKMPMMSTRYGRLASRMADKLRADEYWLNGDKQHWYALDLANLDAAKKKYPMLNSILPAFVQLYDDLETKKFISDSVQLSDLIFTQLWHSAAKTVLSLFFSQTDVNGYLRRGSMFVMSSEHFRLLLSHFLDVPADGPFLVGDLLLDMGAGDGGPTQHLSAFFKETQVTETSWAMRRILAEKGFSLVPVDTWHLKPNTYDMISCLNLLDRCNEPATMLRHVKHSLKSDGGLFLLALVLPFRAYVEFGARNDSHQPLEPLPFAGHTFEEQVASVATYFVHQGFHIKAWTRLPYLCQGDLEQSVYLLNDVVFLMSVDDESTSNSPN